MSLFIRKSVLFAALAGVVCISPFAVPSAFAQSSTTGAIGGTISDAAGALLPGTVVTVTSKELGVTRTVKANSSGEYRITELQPGTYTVTFVSDGFQTSQENAVVVSVGNVSGVSPKLIVGSVTDKVEVTDETPQIKTSGADISTTIDQNTIDNLPINGRRYSDFALLTPGVVSNSDGFGLLSFRGISYLLNNTTVDGADDNQAYFSEARGRTRSSYTVTQGAVQEFQVNTSNYSAEYGRAAGGVINTVTKSGSNQFHGEIFFYDRDASLGGASNPYTQIYNFDENSGIHPQNVKPEDKRYQYGFGIGGPIWKDKVFWFYGFDQQKRNFPGVARTSDPNDMFQVATALGPNEKCQRTPDTFGLFDFGAPTFGYTNPSGQALGGVSVTANLSTPASTAGNYLTNGSVYPIGENYEGNFGACALAAAIAPNTASGANLPYQQAMAYYNQGLGVLSTFFGYVPRIGDQTINFPKIDWQVNDRNRVTAQYNRLRWDSPNGVQTQTSNFDGRGTYGNDFVKADVGVFRVASVLSNSIVNQFLAQYGRDMESEFPSATLPNEQPLVSPLAPGECSAPYGKPCPAGSPDLSVGYGYDAGGFDGGTSALFSRFALPDERRLQLKDDVTWSKGRHTIKFGLDYNKVSDYINNLYNGYGTYDFDWAYSFIGDYLHKVTGLGGAAYAGGGTFNGGDENLGLYSSYSQGFTVPDASGHVNNAGASSLLTTREYAGYATDDWRVTPKLTLTLGVRYEYQYVPINPTPNPDLVGTSNTVGGGLFTANGVTVPNTLSKPDDRNNIAPRLGFAWNVFGDGKTTVRGGYGIYFGRIVNANIEQSYQNSGGPNSQVNISGLFPDITTASAGVCSIPFPTTVTTYTQAIACATATSNASSHPSISYLDSNLQNPQVYETDLDIQQDMGHGWVFDMTYMGSYGRKLDSATDVNLSLLPANIYYANFIVHNTLTPINVINEAALPHGGKPAPLKDATERVKVYHGTRIDPTYYRVLHVSSNVNTNYNALAFQLNKRYKNGFSLLTNYTWSHALDGNPYIGTGIPSYNQLDPQNQSEEYGNSSLDVRQRFVGALTYQPQTHFHGWKDYVLGGWRFAPVVQAQTGLPYTPYIAGYPGESASGVRSANGAGGTSGRIEELERNQYNRPKTVKADIRVGKNFYVPINHYGLDRLRFEVFAEMFNIANHQNITGVNNTAYNLSYTGTLNPTLYQSSGGAQDGIVDTLYAQPNFGTYNNSNSNYTYSPRQIQLAARIHF